LVFLGAYLIISIVYKLKVFCEFKPMRTFIYSPPILDIRKYLEWYSINNVSEYTSIHADTGMKFNSHKYLLNISIEVIYREGVQNLCK